MNELSVTSHNDINEYLNGLSHVFNNIKVYEEMDNFYLSIDDK